MAISSGEALDKLSILEIKLERIKEAQRLANVRAEYQLLRAQLARTMPHALESESYGSLAAVNRRLWDIEDDIRACEARKACCPCPLRQFPPPPLHWEAGQGLLSSPLRTCSLSEPPWLPLSLPSPFPPSGSRPFLPSSLVNTPAASPSLAPSLPPWFWGLASLTILPKAPPSCVGLSCESLPNMPP